MKNTPILKTGRPQKKLIRILKKHSGRDASGKITVPHRGGRQKRYYRLIDFHRNKDKVNGKVLQFEYDPNRTARIALVEYEDGEKRYILAPDGLKTGGVIRSGSEVELKIGNTLPLLAIPLGTEVHNIELYPGRGGQIVKSSGSFAVVVAKDDNYADIKLPSREVRKIMINCKATIGRVSFSEHKLEKIGKAGRKRLMGIRPTVRGVAQNPRSHPHGGGEGRSGESMPPKTKTGRPARGVRTRNKKKWSNKFIVKRRYA